MSKNYACVCANCAYYRKARQRYHIYRVGDCTLHEKPCYASDKVCPDFSTYPVGNKHQGRN